MHATFLHHTFLAHAYLLHAALLVQALFLTHAALIIHTSLIIHAAPILFPLLLSLLMGMLVRNECLLVAHGIIATDVSLMHTAEWSDGCVVRMMRMVLSLTWRCL
jgi:hypothetical protein